MRAALPSRPAVQFFATFPVGPASRPPDDGSVPGERQDWPKDSLVEWIVLVLAGVLEAVWATALAASNNFRRPGPSMVFVAAMAASMAGLAYAMTAVPVGTAYAVWVGIGAVLTAAVAMATGAEKASLLKAALLAGIVGCVVGLKVVG
ncbi:multidrug efflux SMR transporter [Arthrobacter sp. E918]|uniref:Multidrug efflux SMR transporter n=1 Tax=Arthrobacter mobilis TaxID=2724944 RepID=A0A7X6K421_9MICC|nr:multidrug efflux SMR transporter [Arthrobacter mobilis]